jgi:hypothetical protein
MCEPAVRAERGYIEYGPVADAQGIVSFQIRIGPDTLFVIEKCQDVMR